MIEMKRMLATIVVGLLAFSGGGFAIAQQPNTRELSEKPLIIRGMRLGMDINEARTRMVNLLGKDWKVSRVGKKEDVLADYHQGDTTIFFPEDFGRKDPWRKTDPSDFKLPGEWGFAIQDKDNYYSGYVSADKSSNKVTRISFGGKITEYILSASKIDIESFVSLFRKHFNLPEFNWFTGGWMYISPHGYKLTIRKDKFIDILQNDELKRFEEELKFD